MDRPRLEALYRTSSGSPSRVFARALSTDPLRADVYSFLLSHVGELDIENLLRLFELDRVEDVAWTERPFLQRLVDLLPGAPTSDLLAVLDVAHRISAEAWIEDVVLPLRPRLPKYEWYRFVDEARGCELFNALNRPPARPPLPPAVHPRAFDISVEQERPEPFVVPLLERAHDERDVRAFALAALPVPQLLALHRRLPSLLERDDLESVLAARAVSDPAPWLEVGGEPLPAWLGPHLAVRVETCGDDEACLLFDWLTAQPGAAKGRERFGLALRRFRLAPQQPYWHRVLGSHLTSAAAWKRDGGALIESCIDMGKGFPPRVLDVALSHDGPNPEVDAGDRRRAILARIHDQLATAVLKRLERDLHARDFESAERYVSALLSLDPGSFSSGEVRRLEFLEGVPVSLRERLAAIRELYRAGGREASTEGFFEAFLVLSGQLQ